SKVARPGPSAVEHRHQFEVRGPYELVDRHDALQTKPAGDQLRRIAGKGRGVAGHGNDRGNRRLCECFSLVKGAGARRVDYRGGIRSERLGRQRIAGEVTSLGGDAWPAGRGAGERSDSNLVAVN